MAAVISRSTGNQFDDEQKRNVIYVPNAFINVDESDNNSTAALQGNAEKFKIEFAYEIAK